MNIKKVISFLIFMFFMLNTVGCSVCCAARVDSVQQAKKEINRLKWLEGLETNKLYKNQQKLENAEANLSNSKQKL